MMPQQRADGLRPTSLPAELSCYRRIGPFDETSLPKGLLREHRLKEGAWAVVTVLAGSIDFAWDDRQGGIGALSAPDSVVVPPAIPHHIDISGPFSLQIEFYSSEDR